MKDTNSQDAAATGWNPWPEQDRRALPAHSLDSISGLEQSFRQRMEHLIGISATESAFHRIQESWQQFTGLLAMHCSPQEIKDDRLVVYVAESVYAQELQLHSRQILKSIEKTLGISLKGIQIRRNAYRK